MEFDVYNGDEAIEKFIVAGIASINNFLRRIEFLLCSNVIEKLDEETLKEFRKGYRNLQKRTPVRTLHVKIKSEEKAEE